MPGHSRRDFLRASAAGLLAPPQPGAQQRPNILFLSCEDMSPDLGCYGDAYSRSPNLDRLANQGARYTSAFSVAGVCAPSRSGIITAMYPSSIGTHHMRSLGVPPAEVKCFPEYLRAAGYYCTNNVKTDYNFAAPLTAWDESGNRAHWRNRPTGRPFFSVFNITTTHESQVRADAQTFARHMERVRPQDRHDPAGAQLPPYYPDTPVVRRDWANYYDLITSMDAQVGAYLRQLEEDGLADNTVVFFWSDHGRGLPRAKRWIYDSGVHVPLLVRWPGRMAPGTVREDLVSLIDLGPTALSIAGLEPPRHMQGRAFFGPKASAPRDYIFCVRDRMDEAYDMMRAVRDRRFKYIRNYQPGKPYVQYIDYMEQMPTMRELRRLNKEGKLTGAQRLWFRPEKPVDELYDLTRDPHEINNLAGSAEHRAVYERMRKVHEDWMREIGDLGQVPEDQLQERWRPGGRWSQTAEPAVLPAGGSFSAPVRVQLACSTPGASLGYTTEQGDNVRWQLYTGELAIDRTATLRVRAGRIGFLDSSEVRAEFRVG